MLTPRKRAGSKSPGPEKVDAEKDLARAAALRSVAHARPKATPVHHASYVIRANLLLTYAQKPRTETEEKACSSERAKEAVR